MSTAGRFAHPRGPFSLADLCVVAEARPGAGCDPARLVHDAVQGEYAGPDDITYLEKKSFLDALAAGNAGFCLVRAELAEALPGHIAAVLCQRPALAFARLRRHFHPRPVAVPGTAPGAVVAADARLGAGVEIGAGAIIGARADIGPGCIIGANAVIGDDVVLGAEVIVGPLVSIRHAVVGDRCTFLAGARIGEDGFGFVPDPPRGHLMLPHLGGVVIGAEVVIGANSCVDRGAQGDTVIGDAAIVDNLVQIGHNVTLGRGSVLAGLAGIAGSSRIGAFAVLGGASGVADHVTIGEGARVAARAAVMRDVAPGETVAGVPAVPVKQFFREVATIARLARGKKDG